MSIKWASGYKNDESYKCYKYTHTLAQAHGRTKRNRVHNFWRIFRRKEHHMILDRSHRKAIMARGVGLVAVAAAH